MRAPGVPIAIERAGALRRFTRGIFYVNSHPEAPGGSLSGRPYKVDSGLSLRIELF